MGGRKDTSWLLAHGMGLLLQAQLKVSFNWAQRAWAHHSNGEALSPAGQKGAGWPWLREAGTDCSG